MTAYRFDEVLIVDWSASSRPSPQPAPDSIWIGRTDANGVRAVRKQVAKRDRVKE